jgi:prepilin-type N-terminal cleavage/methylation domain-containing protein
MLALKKRNLPSGEGGYTLLEILIVLLVLGILVALLLLCR